MARKRKIEVIPELQLYRRNSKNYTFEYVWRKHLALVEWCGKMKHGVNKPIKETMYGTEYGWGQYIQCVKDVETYCRTFRVTCDAMLYDRMAFCEGMFMRVIFNNGRSVTGILHEEGELIRYYEVRKDGNRAGVRIAPWNIDWAMVI